MYFILGCLILFLCFYLKYEYLPRKFRIFGILLLLEAYITLFIIFIGCLFGLYQTVKYFKFDIEHIFALIAFIGVFKVILIIIKKKWIFSLPFNIKD